MTTTLYNIATVAEGGPGQAFAAQVARELGATRVQRTPSRYVGMTAVLVTATADVHRRIKIELYGRA